MYFWFIYDEKKIRQISINKNLELNNLFNIYQYLCDTNIQWSYNWWWMIYNHLICSYMFKIIFQYSCLNILLITSKSLDACNLVLWSLVTSCELVIISFLSLSSLVRLRLSTLSINFVLQSIKNISYQSFLI